MKKLITCLLTILIACTTYGQRNANRSINGLMIDPGVKDEVEKHISRLRLENMPNEAEDLVYNNTIIGEMYENDKQIVSLTSALNKKSVFRSFYYWQGDTLGIDGAFGMYTGVGFSIKVVRNNAVLYHLLSAGENPSYAYQERDSLKFRLEVPCSDTKIILSELPDFTNAQTIYGYVEFKSESYYQSKGLVDGEEVLPRKKEKGNMKIYFKSFKLVI